MHRRVIIILVLGGLTQSCAGGDTNPHYECRWYLIRECGTGHPGGVKFVEEDSQGNIWTTSANCWGSSLWQFDGTEWKRHYRVTREGSSLWSAASRENDALYVATEQGLLQLQDDSLTLHTQMFIVAGFMGSRFGYAPDSFFDAVPTRLLHVDKRDEVWVYSPRIGLFRHTGEIWNEHTTYWPQDGERKRIIDLLDRRTVTALYSSDEETLLVGTSTGSVYVLRERPSARDAQGTDIELAAEHTAAEIGIPEASSINSIASDAEEGVWIAYSKGNDDGGVAYLTSDAWKVFNHTNSRLPSRKFTAIASIPGGKIWAGVDWNGQKITNAPFDETGLFEFADGTWKCIETAGFSGRVDSVVDNGPGEPREVSLNNEFYRIINCISPDSRGNIWVGTEGGLACFVPVTDNEMENPQ